MSGLHLCRSRRGGLYAETDEMHVARLLSELNDDLQFPRGDIQQRVDMAVVEDGLDPVLVENVCRSRGLVRS